MTISSKQTQLTSAEAIDAGLTKHFSNNKQQLMFGGATYTPVTVDKFIQSLIALINDVNAARATYQAKVKVMRAQAPALRKQLAAFVAFVRATFGNQPDVLADFGLAPHKEPAPKTVETKATAVEKTLATRAARGTKGKKQKAAIHGTLPVTEPAVAATPAPTGTAPAAPSQPTGSTPSTGSAPTGSIPPTHS
jgi:hypothetical protein